MFVSFKLWVGDCCSPAPRDQTPFIQALLGFLWRWRPVPHWNVITSVGVYSWKLLQDSVQDWTPALLLWLGEGTRKNLSLGGGWYLTRRTQWLLLLLLFTTDWMLAVCRAPSLLPSLWAICEAVAVTALFYSWRCWDLESSLPEVSWLVRVTNGIETQECCLQKPSSDRPSEPSKKAFCVLRLPIKPNQRYGAEGGRGGRSPV